MNEGIDSLNCSFHNLIEDTSHAGFATTMNKNMYKIILSIFKFKKIKFMI